MEGARRGAVPVAKSARGDRTAGHGKPSAPAKAHIPAKITGKRARTSRPINDAKVHSEFSSLLAMGSRRTAIMARHRLRLVNRTCAVSTRNPMCCLGTNGQVSLGRHWAARVARPSPMTEKMCDRTKMAVARSRGLVGLIASGARGSKIQPDHHVQMFLRCNVAATIALARAGRRSMTPRSPTREEHRSQYRAERVV